MDGCLVIIPKFNLAEGPGAKYHCVDTFLIALQYALYVCGVILLRQTKNHLRAWLGVSQATPTFPHPEPPPR